MQRLIKFEFNSWSDEIVPEMQKRAVKALEEGRVLYFPHLPFVLSKDEYKLLTPAILDPKRKNVSYNLKDDQLGGTVITGEEAALLRSFVKRYATVTASFLKHLIPAYSNYLVQGRTSFRPAEIEGRKSSPKKDDTRLHVDAFPSTPTGGKRILRLFSNINLEGKPRVWRVGEPFADVVKRLGPRISKPIWGIPHLLSLLKITKTLRTSYDHYMLQLHDTMKLDDNYQKSVSQEEILFPAGSSWMVYTDQVSHAALSGQHVLEQTFYLPQEGLKHPSISPLKVLEKYFSKSLTC